MAENNPQAINPRTTTVRRLAGLAITYAVGEVFLKGLNYLMLPLYLQYLPPEEYGIISITEILRTVFMMLLSFGMTSTILRFTHVIKDEEQREFFGTIWMFLILAAGVTTFLLLAFSPPWFSKLLPTVAFDPYIRKTLLTAFFTSTFALLPATLFRARDQAKQFVLFGMFSTISILTATIIHVVILGQRANGWVQAQLEAAVAVAIISTYILAKQVRLNFKWKHLRGALVFSIPLMPHFLSHWILGVSDRIILEHFVGFTELGLYTLGYQFGQGYQVLITGINNAFIPMFGRASKEPRERARLPRMLTYYLLAVTIPALLIALNGDDLILLLFPANYASAARIVPWIILGYLAFAIYYIPMNFLSMTVGETKSIPITTITAAGINLILNLVFIPRYGAIAAAVNTAIAYIVLALGLFLLAKRTGFISLERDRVSKLFFSAALIYFLGNSLMHAHPLTNLAIGIGVILFLPMLLAILGFWNSDEYQQLRHQISRIRGALNH
jgi:O-antigen/teichoic acid export membrane protein